MNTSQFMDKQIMDLSGGSLNNDFIDLMNPQEDHQIGGGGNKKEEMLPNYDFQPIRPLGASQSLNLDGTNVGGSRAWNSADSKTNSTGLRNYGSLDSVEPAKVVQENIYDVAIISEIDRTMKKHADNLLHALEGVSARLSQLESRTRHLENSVDDMKVSIGNNSGSTDGKMRQLENILREVQTGVQVLRDKQEIVEAQLQLSKLQVSKVDQQPETQKSGHIDSVQQAASAPQQSHQQFPQPVTLQPSLIPLPPPNAPPPPPPPPPQQNLPPPIPPLPNHFPQNQIPSVPQRDPYFQPPVQTQEAPNLQYQLPPTQQPQPPLPVAPHQQYQPAPHPQYSQPPQPPQQHPSPVNPPQLQPPLSHNPEESPYIPSQNYPPSLRQPPSHAPSGSAPSQQFYGPPSHMYEPPSSRSSSGFSSGYGAPTGPSEPYPYSGSASQFGSGSTMKPQQLPSSAMTQSGGSGYPQLPTARILPQALPTASGVGAGSGSTGTGNKVPIDDVVDKVTNMGFPRDHVRATVRKLTENGQTVDLNVVLDKLMNDGEIQPPKGWFGR